MKVNKNRTRIITGATTAILGMALISLVSCSSGESTNNTIAPGGSAGLSGPMVFVNNTGDKSLTSVALKGDSGNAVVGTIPNTEFEGVALGDMQFSEGNWLFLNITGINALNQPIHKVATIDPLTNALPVHEVNLTSGTRPVHLYRDTTDGEHIWSMNDGDNATGTTTPGDDLINCAVQTGGSVTILHNSHLGPGATPPFVIKTECLLADGHKVAAFSAPTTANPNTPKRVFISSTTAGEIAVIDNDPANLATYQKLIARIDLCTNAGEALNAQVPCDVNTNLVDTPNTPNKSNPHGIRFSKLTGKIYSIQENYRTIVEVDPATLAVTLVADLSTTNYTAYGISPDGRFLLLRGQTTAPQATKLGVIDLGNGGLLTSFTISALDNTVPGSFKFSPDGKRFYILAGNSTLGTVKKDRLFAFDSSTLIPVTPATEPALTLLPNGEIPLLQTGAHSMDVLAQGATGAGEAKYIVISNTGTPGSVSIINAADNLIKQNVDVGPAPGSVMIYYPGAAAAENQASS
jgi:hypothetical protein